MNRELSLDIINRTTFEREDVVKYYRKVETFLDAERVLLSKLLPEIKDLKILDIGIGGGRTTPHLLQISSDYTGIDYVPQLAEETAKKYPEAKILCADATNLREFGDETFDFVLFSYNGLDCMSHEGRLKVLSEIYRTLKKNGICMFSSHNRDYKYFNTKIWKRKICLKLDYLIFLLHCLYHLPNHYKMKRHEIYTDDYAIVNDGDHRFSLMLYYISIEQQRKQLIDIGFADIEAYDTNGAKVQMDTSSHWLHYLARKK